MHAVNTMMTTVMTRYATMHQTTNPSCSSQTFLPLFRAPGVTYP